MKLLLSEVKLKEMIEPRRAQRARSQLFMIQSKKTDWIIGTPQRILPGAEANSSCPKGAGVLIGPLSGQIK